MIELKAVKTERTSEAYNEMPNSCILEAREMLNSLTRYSQLGNELQFHVCPV